MSKRSFICNLLLYGVICYLLNVPPFSCPSNEDAVAYRVLVCFQFLAAMKMAKNKRLSMLFQWFSGCCIQNLQLKVVVYHGFVVHFLSYRISVFELLTCW